LLGFMLENRLRQTEQEVQRATEQLNALNVMTRERLGEHRRQRGELLELARRQPTQSRIRVLLSDALDAAALAPPGPRVAIPGSSLRLRFWPQDAEVVAQIEEEGGAPVSTVHWPAGESLSAFARRVVAALRSKPQSRGLASLDASAVLQRLLDLVQLGVESRTGERPHDLGPLIEMPNDQWVISSDGLFSLRRKYHIPVQGIVGSRDYWPRHMQSHAWVDSSAFEEAFQLARQLLRAGGPGNAAS
jgi:hypothetical protein